MSAQPAFQLLPITWQTFSTICTFLAVAVAIAFPILRDRRRLKLKLRIGQMVGMGNPPETFIRTSLDPNAPLVRESGRPVLVVLTVTNRGRVPVIIDGWEFRRQEQRDRSFLKSDYVTYPVELNPGRSARLVAPDFLNFIPQLGDMWVTDTFGKNWKVQRSDIRRIRKFRPDALSGT